MYGYQKLHVLKATWQLGINYSVGENNWTTDNLTDKRIEIYK